MAFKLGSGIAETTTTTGTGTITLGGAVSGYLAFSTAVGVNDTTLYRIDNGAGTWEVGVGTRATTTTITRDTILVNSSGSTSAINFGSGTKTISCVGAGEVTPATNQTNEWTAAQNFNDQQLRLNSAKDTYIVGGLSSGTEVADLYVDGEFVARFTADGLRILSDDAGAGSGPVLAMDRNSASPADNDVLGSLEWRGRDDGANSTTYARILGEASDVTDATEDGRLKLGVMNAGTLTNTLTIEPNLVHLPASTVVLIGKSTSSGSTAGVEFEAGGVLRVTRSGANMATFNRLASIGSVMAFQYADSTKGSIEVSTTATTYNTTSDGRLKRDIVDYSDGLDIVLRLRAVEYGWRDEPGAPREVGLIAQDVLEVIPQIVSGQHSEDANDPLGVDYGRLTPWLISAVQTLAARVEELERRIAQ